MLVVWRFTADGERLAGSLSAGDDSLIVEFALEALSCAFRSPCVSIAGLSDSLAWYNAFCCTRARDAAIRALTLSALVEALARGAYVQPFNGDADDLPPLHARPPASPLERQLLISPIAYSNVVVRLDELIEARRLYRLSRSPANQRALFKTVVYGGQSTDTPDGRWGRHKQRKPGDPGDHLMLLVTRCNGASALPANTRSIGELSVPDECALELFKPLFAASGTFEAGSGDRATWLLDDLRARACASDQLERVARQLLRTLSSERTEIESVVNTSAPTRTQLTLGFLQVCECPTCQERVANKCNIRGHLNAAR